ncbi:MAG: hypothetical protein VYD70_00630, partial [Planctomycetota bacterium]|nr:hypothetical protein [Planctomycetota bacterium]
MRFWFSTRPLACFSSLLLISTIGSSLPAQTCAENLQVYPSYSQQEMVLEWTLPPTGVSAAQFEIFRDGVVIATVDSSTTSYVDDVSSLVA